MFRKSILAISAISMAAVPAVADAHRYRGYDNGYAYAQGYYPQQSYGYGNGYYGRSYEGRRHHCSGTTGTIVGAGAGALLGRSIVHRNSGTGTILGAALGALVGRQVGKSTC